MDTELKEFLEHILSSVMNEMSKRFEEVNHRFDRRFDQVDARLDQMNSRLEKQGGLIQSGSRALTRLIQWSEDTDGALSKVLVRLGTVEGRLDKLEGKQ